MLQLCLPVLGVLSLAAGAWAQAPRGLPDLVIPDGFGVNIHFVEPNATEADLLAAGGAKFIRMDFGWDGIERKRGEYDFSGYDKLVQGMLDRGVRLLLILDYGNDLYSAKGDSPRTEEAWNAFARWAAASARHYAGKGIVWEIFNEPNIGFWHPTPNVDEYSKLCLAVIPAMRAADPKAFIVAPGSSGFDWAFYEGMGKHGVWKLLDGASVHPYRGACPETAGGDYRRLRGLLSRFCPGRKLPIIASEWGYSTQQGGLPELTQAQYLARQRLADLAYDVPISIWYDWHNDSPDPKDNESNFGTVYQDFKPKPSYLAGQTLAKTLNGYRFVRRANLLSVDDWALVFRKGPDVALALWTTAEDHEVTVPVPAGEVRVVEMMGADRTVTAGAADPKGRQEDGLKLTLSGSPQYALLPRSEAATLLGCWEPVDPWVTVRAGVDTRLPVRVQNPTNHRLTFELRMAGGRFLTPAAVDVGPGKETTVQVPLRVDDRSSEEVTVGVQAISGQKPHPLSTSPVYVHVANSLQLQTLPPVGGILGIEVGNPSGEALKARLRVAAADPQGRPAGPAAVEAPLVLEVGQTEKTVSVLLPKGFPPDALLSISAADGQGRPILTLPPEKWSPICPLVPDDVWRAWTEGDAKVAGSASVSVVPSPEPPAQPGLTTALQLDHRFAEGWRFACWNPPAKMEAIPGEPRAVGMWVFGDGSGDPLSCRVTDSTGQTFQPHYGPITWKGWRFVTMDLPARGLFCWGGAGDGVMHYPIHWTALVLIDPLAGNRNQDLRVYATGFALQS
jgi:hypothetical protein